MRIKHRHLVITAFIMAVSGCKTATVATVQEPLILPEPERLFLQQVTSNSAIIKWRGEPNSACVSTSIDELTVGKGDCVDALLSDSNHKESLFSNLTPDTDYFYSVGGFTKQALRFRTAPITGKLPEDGNTHIWIVGDSGTDSSVNKDGEPRYPGQAKAVLDGFLSYNASQQNEPVDLFLMLGDNAYPDGTDAQWQKAVFDLYPRILRQAALWPTIGNHEMGSIGGSVSDDPESFVSAGMQAPIRMPYLDIFSLPTRGESGGVASGTEQYYAFDYGNVHIVCLDSQLSIRDEIQRSAMKEWLIADLGSNQLDWTVVFFHHPPYTKGSHDSDKRGRIDDPIVDMRLEFTETFEEHGVDLVYSGHSHSYERSYYLNGHRGTSDTFDASVHAELNSTGELASGNGDDIYHQISSGSNLDDKVVYTVAGSSGKISLGRGKLDHPAHIVQPHDSEGRRGLLELGSVVLDASASELTARFIDTSGDVLDTVTIRR